MSALRILLVEDETRLADAVKKGLGEEGFTVETAESAETAEPIIARSALDLIVLDLTDPTSFHSWACVWLKKKEMPDRAMMSWAVSSVPKRTMSVRRILRWLGCSRCEPCRKST